MPVNTVTEFRGRNRFRSSNTKNSRKGYNRRAYSPPPKDVGNSARIGCSFCNPTLTIRVTNRRFIRNIIRNKENDFYDLENVIIDDNDNNIDTGFQSDDSF